MNLRFKDRIILNKNRLLNYDDTYNDLYEKDASMSWPGDFVGRYSLALSSLYEGLDNINDKNEVLEALKKTVNKRDKHVNKNHFFGKLFNDEIINEQQMSGNSWYIRSLVNYYKLTNDKNILDEINDIINNFLLKLAPHYKHYPICKRTDGEVSGHSEENVTDGYILSSDVGCAFILLDGYVDAYSITKNKELETAIKDIINIFMGIDYMTLKCQTHATLTCSRAILRFYQLTNDKKYLDFVIKTYENYQKYGMTIDYQNINWFGKLDSWTEPCCVIDSFILAHDLYLITNDQKYLKLFNKISTNGPRIFQRDNGGAGCTTIVTKKEDILKCFMYEAWFCCSMRMGEGMKYLSKSRLIKKDDDSCLIMYPEKIDQDGIYVDIDYYYNKSISISSDKDVKLEIYIPDGFKVLKSNVKYEIDKNLLKINVNKNININITCELGVNKENDVYYYGDMLLTQKENHVDEIIEIDNKKYSYVLSSANYSKEEIEKIEQFL